MTPFPPILPLRASTAASTLGACPHGCLSTNHTNGHESVLIREIRG